MILLVYYADTALWRWLLLYVYTDAALLMLFIVTRALYVAVDDFERRDIYVKSYVSVI